MPFRLLPKIVRKRRRSRAKHLAGISDINLVAKAAAVETLRKIDAPEPADLARFDRIAVLAPHQDDELIGAGGLCALAGDAGAEIALVFLTDGAQRGMTDAHGGALSSREAAAIRQAEAKEVCAALGAEYACIGIDNVTMATERSHVEALARVLSDYAPDVILLPWLFDSAPKHRMASHLLWLASRTNSRPVAEIWGYQVNNGLFANAVLDITAIIERKLDLIRLYRSQNTFLRRFDHQAMGLGAWNSRYLPSKGAALSASYAELFLTLTSVEWDSLVEQFYLCDLATVYHGNKKLIRSMTGLHRAISG